MSRHHVLRQVSHFSSFLRDQRLTIIVIISALVLLILFLLAYHTQLEIILLVCIIFITVFIRIFSYEYRRRRKFYQTLIKNLENLDQAYLILETLEPPSFYDGQIFYRALYQIDKSMAENVQCYRKNSQDFQEYVEMWIHEVKTPLATLAVIANDPRINEQIKYLDDYVEQILYFARAENAERDYLIKPTNLAKVVNGVANRNREILLTKHIDFLVQDLDYKVYTDAKWLEFIINQVVNNSIKYQSRQIKIRAINNTDTITLKIRDDGIGIDAKDLPRVFEKSFTGHNGHHTQKSTGMGLYIAKTLCEKLGHQINIYSELHHYTEVEIIMAKNEYYNVLDANLTKK